MELIYLCNSLTSSKTWLISIVFLSFLLVKEVIYVSSRSRSSAVKYLPSYLDIASIASLSDCRFISFKSLLDFNDVGLLNDFAQSIFEAREFFDDLLDFVQVFSAKLGPSLLRGTGNNCLDG